MLRDSLKKAGLQDIMILDSAYLVQAKNSDGDSVVMLINPPAVMGRQGLAHLIDRSWLGTTDGGLTQKRRGGAARRAKPTAAMTMPASAALSSSRTLKLAGSLLVKIAVK